jgi:hypothetical protein
VESLRSFGDVNSVLEVAATNPPNVLVVSIPKLDVCDNPKTAAVIAASASIAVEHAAMDAAIANYPDQRFTPRNGILVIRQHPRT